MAPPVLGGQLEGDVPLLRAETGAVLQQALLAALEVQDELGDRGVGDALEAGAGPAFDRVDEADDDDVELASQVGDDVGEFSVAAV